MILDLLLPKDGVRYGIDGGTISTYRDLGYLRDRLLKQVESHFLKVAFVPTGFKCPFSPKSIIRFSNPTRSGIDILLRNIGLLGQFRISYLEPYLLVQFDSLSEAQSFQEKFTRYLQKDRSFSTVIVDSGDFVGKVIPEHCYPGKTFYINSKSKKRIDVGYVSRDKLQPTKWAFKYEVRIKPATEIKRLAGISCLFQLADLVGDPEKIKGLMERLLKNVYYAKVDQTKLSRWLMPTDRRGTRSMLRATQFLRVLGSIHREQTRAVDDPTPPMIQPPDNFELDSYDVFKQAIKKWQMRIRENRGRRSKFAQKLLNLNPGKFKLKEGCDCDGGKSTVDSPPKPSPDIEKSRYTSAQAEFSFGGGH